jgi:hyperosmotically inducible periplasmic protein
MNKLKCTWAVLLAAALLGLAGCASLGKVGKDSRAFLDDAAITARVKSAFFNEPALKVLAISVKTDRKVVELSGAVKSRAERARAAEVAWNVEGVKRVKNELKVR